MTTRTSWVAPRLTAIPVVQLVEIWCRFAERGKGGLFFQDFRIVQDFFTFFQDLYYIGIAQDFFQDFSVSLISLDQNQYEWVYRFPRPEGLSIST